MEEVRDIQGKIIKIGDKIVYEDYNAIYIGYVQKFCNNSIKIGANMTEFSRRLIVYRLVPKKVYVIEEEKTLDLTKNKKEYVGEERFSL